MTMLPFRTSYPSPVTSCEASYGAFSRSDMMVVVVVVVEEEEG
jgi:hypothetical protein